MGAALVATWAGGTGIASATEGAETPIDSGSGCEAPLPVEIDGEASADTLTEGEGTDEGKHEDDPISPEPCSDVTVVVVADGNCKDPETFTFVVDAENLAAGATYTLLLGSEDIVPSDVPFVEEITADENGDVVDHTFTETEGDAFTAPSTGLTFEYVLFDGYDSEWPQIVGGGKAELGECTTEPTTPVEPAQPVTPAPAPAPVAPVVVAHPAAAQPAVLANTGTPVTAAALLGGGMLVVGAGALVATRRRAS